MKLKLILAFCLIVCSRSWSQKPALSAKEYDLWNSLKNPIFSNNGTWLAYEIAPYRGDSRGIIMKTDSTFVREIPRFVPNAFLGVDRYLIGVVKPQFDTLRKKELEKVKKEKMPKDSLLVYYFSKDSVVKIPNVIDFKYAANGLWLAYRNLDKANMEVEKKVPDKKRAKWPIVKKTKKEAEEPKIESEGKVLTIWHPAVRRKIHLNYVTTYEFSDSAKYIAVVSHQKKNKRDAYNLKILDIPGNAVVYESPVFTQVGKMSWHKSQQYFAFLASQDTNSNNKHFSLYLLDFGNSLKLTTLDSLKIRHPESFIPSNFGQLTFAEDGNRLFFGLGPKPTYDAKDSLTASEKVKLDIWHWQDRKLQPRQLLAAKKDKNVAYLSYYDWDKEEIHVLENDSLKVKFDPKQTRVFLTTNDDAYALEQDYDYPWKRDEYFLIPDRQITLSNPLLFNAQSAFGSVLSPDGKYAIRYNSEKNQFILMNTEDQSVQCLSCDFKTDWFEDLNGQIYQAQPEVRFVWENDRNHIWLLTEQDIFRINLQDGKATRITKNIGHELKQRFTVVNWDKDSSFVNPERCFLLGFSKLTKESNVYVFENGTMKLKKNIYANISGLQRVNDSDFIEYRVSTVSQFPNIILDNASFTSPKRITDINPQQKNFNWARVELVKWKTKSNIELEGLLYTPENLDTNGSYPMIVYFYELNSDNIHRHWTPKPTASIVHPTEYCSGGYVIFIPDIRYQPGYPAQGAYDCIMSGTDYVLSKFKFIDPNRIGLQGQSWGGYQTAQLITMTTRYKAAMAGAPVANMFSAYGGIRWGSGLSRQFQYEHAQSRIGATIWERPDLYTLNSPLFALPKVQTPLLIMHNDNDGAVPWYQGIELYMGLRRLQKPVWLLNYNGDEHNLINEAHRKDLSMRMRQFFDFYLNNGVMPNWMKEGVKAVDKP
jgi:dipeptidyl aminopeptidase/acylaminoacyl peptidase